MIKKKLTKQEAYSKNEKKKKTRRALAAIFCLLGAGAIGASSFMIWKSCSMPISSGLFEIKQIEGKNVLVGFDKRTTTEEIVETLKGTLTIPNNIDIVADNAFFRDNKSTIPPEITKLDISEGNLETIGENAFRASEIEGVITIPSNIKTLKDGAFYSCKKITGVILKSPDINIGKDEGIGSFAECPLISMIDLKTWPEAKDLGINTFKNAAKAGTIYIYNETNASPLANQWKEIFTNNYDFRFGKSYWKFDPDTRSVFDINGDELIGFAEDVDLELIKETFPDGNLIIPDEVTKIRDDAFFRNNQSTFEPFKEFLISLTLPNNLVTIGKQAFKQMPISTELNLSENFVRVGESAFAASKITSLTLQNSNIEIAQGAFMDCQDLKAIDLTTWQEAKSFGTDVFKNISDKGKITIKDRALADSWKVIFTKEYGLIFNVDTGWTISPDSIFNIVDNVLYGFNDDITSQDILEVFPDKILVIPNGTTSIANNAFWNRETSTIEPFKDYLTSLKLPEQLLSIGDNAFKESPLGGKLELPNSLKTIGQGAFYKNSNITSVNIPKGVKINSVEFNGVFQGCIGLAEIHIEEWETVATLEDWGKDTFSNVYTDGSQGVIYINNVDLASGWRSFFNHNFGIPFNPYAWRVSPDMTDVLDISEDKTTLYGFKPEVTELDIEVAYPNGIIDIPDTITTIADNAFWKEGTIGTIPNGIKTITFNDPTKITYIGNRAFMLNIYLEEIDINKLENIATIGIDAFSGCVNLSTFDHNSNDDKMLKLPDYKLSSIGDRAFYGCAIKGVRLPTMYMDSTTVGANVFSGNNETLLTIDLSGLFIIDIFGSGYDRYYQEDSSLQYWISQSSYTFGGFGLQKDESGKVINKIIVPFLSQHLIDIGYSPTSAFLLADDKQESLVHATHSGLYWLGSGCSLEDKINLGQWNIE